MTCRNRIILTLFLCCIGKMLTAMNIVNTLWSSWPYDSIMRPSFTNKYRWQIGAYVETGYRNAQGYNDNGDHVNPLQIWNSQQNALTMLEGFSFDSDKGQLRSALLDSNNGIRGHFNVDGDLRLDF